MSTYRIIDVHVNARARIKRYACIYNMLKRKHATPHHARSQKSDSRDTLNTTPFLDSERVFRRYRGYPDISTQLPALLVAGVQEILWGELRRWVFPREHVAT